MYDAARTLQSLQRVRERRRASCHFSRRERAVAPVARNLVTGHAGPRLVQGVAQRARDSFPNKDDGLPRFQRLDELEAARGGFSRGGRDGRADPERRRGHGVPQRCGARRRRSHLFQLSSLNTREVRQSGHVAPRRHHDLFEEALLVSQLLFEGRLLKHEDRDLEAVLLSRRLVALPLVAVAAAPGRVLVDVVALAELGAHAFGAL